MTMLIITLRILYIIAGILWAGGAMIDFIFIEPAARATSPESQKFMGCLMTLIAIAMLTMSTARYWSF